MVGIDVYERGSIKSVIRYVFFVRAISVEYEIFARELRSVYIRTD